VPAIGVAQRAGGERGDERAEIDRAAVDLKSEGAAPIVGGVQFAQLRRQIAAQQPCAEDQKKQRKQEGLVEGHAEMSGRHQQRAERDGTNPPEQAIAQKPAECRCKIDETDIDAEDLGRERLGRKRPGHKFDDSAKLRESHDVLDVAGKQKLVDHIEHEKRLHAVKRDALPQFRGGDEHEPARLAEDEALVRGMVRRAHHEGFTLISKRPSS
jgi:hypothetical protein